MFKTLAFISLFTALVQPALSSQTSWVETEGGAMRLVIADDGKTATRGFIEIKLNPGWKTYWREPGDGGIPPSLSGKGMAIDLLFPAPERISQGDQVFSGYHDAVSLPFVLPQTLDSIDSLTAFIGICSDICVPFQADFPMVRDNTNLDLVDEAFANLPKQATEGEGITDLSRSGDQLVLKTNPGGVDLFLAPEKGVYFASPVAVGSGFSVKVLREKQPGLKVNYTLKTETGAISGSFDMLK